MERAAVAALAIIALAVGHGGYLALYHCAMVLLALALWQVARGMARGKAPPAPSP